ncbi:MAG: condensation domain-containing protein [Streptosporangiaceae bacterium]
MTIREVPASIGQRLLWMMDRRLARDAALNEPLVWRLRGPLDAAALRLALTRLTQRHEALRTIFTTRRRRLMQVIADESEIDVAWSDVSGTADPEAAAWHALHADLLIPVDPVSCPLRAAMWRIRDDDHLFCVNMHHLVTDGWSAVVISRELDMLYRQITTGGPELPPVGWQYAQWTQWQEQRLTGERLQRLREYWARQLSGAQVPELPIADPGRLDTMRSGTALEHAHEHAYIEPHVVRALDGIGRSHRTTRFGVMLAVYYALLHRVTGQRDLAVASLFANRTRPEVARTVGFFVNLLIVRARLPAAATFDDLVRETRGTVLGAMLHQELPYQMLPPFTVQGTFLRPDNVVFQVVEKPVEAPGSSALRIEPVERFARTRFAIELALVPESDGLTALLLYASEVFDRGWARKFLDDYVAFAAMVAAAPDLPLNELAA